MANTRYLGRLEEKKKASTAQLLFRCARLLDQWALSRIRERTSLAQVRSAHTSLLPHLDFKGVRLTDLAERLDVSKQAAFQLVEEMEELGLVERRSDPEDGRAKLIRFSRKGQRALLHGLGILAELEDELAAAIGRKRFVQMHDALLALVPVLEAKFNRGSLAIFLSR